MTLVSQRAHSLLAVKLTDYSFICLSVVIAGRGYDLAEQGNPEWSIVWEGSSNHQITGCHCTGWCVGFCICSQPMDHGESSEHSSLRISSVADTPQSFIPRPFPSIFTSNTHVLSLLIAGVVYWLPLNFPANLTSKHSLRFRTTRDHLALLGSIFAFQAFVFRPQPNQLDSLLIGPLALVTLTLYEPPLPPLKEESQSVSVDSVDCGVRC